MTRQEQNTEAGRKFGAAVNAGGVVERIFGYVVSYVVLVAILSLLYIMVSNDHNAFARAVKNSEFLAFLVIYIVPALLMFLWERGVRKFRRKNGLSVYGNIAKDLEQMKYNEEYAKEAKAREAYEASKK